MKKLTISKRASQTPLSAIRKYIPLAEAAKKRGTKIYYLHIGQPDMHTPDEILEQYRNISSPILEYAPSNGAPDAVSAWQEFYRQKGIDYQPSQIVLTSGAAEALMFAFFAVADPTEELIVLEPFYTSYAMIAAMGNITLVPVTTAAGDGYHLPPDSVIEKVITAKTRALVVCNPNNPTGTVYSNEEVKRLAAIAMRHNLFLISDETYQDIVFDGKRVLPFAALPELNDSLIVVDSASKRFNVCGARVGCVASHNAEVMQVVLRFAQGRLSIGVLDQHAIVPMLRDWKPYVAGITREYQKRRDAAVRVLQSIPGVSVKKPEGAFYIMATLPVDDADTFVQFLLSDFSYEGETVMVSPGSGFYATPGAGKREVRIAFVLEEEKIRRALQLLSKAITEYNTRQ